ncbi:MAG: quercetin dioxygenase-like cupin family protein [Gammaproteobacteria bacterium]|jgi:quercetin dioxygenase-like cupin family protein
MRVVTLNDIAKVDLGEATPIPGWTGGKVTRSRQTVIAAGESANYSCSVVNFSLGSTTGWHIHDCDQILIVTHGSGMVADEQHEVEINVGDVVHVKAGEKHWHGAKADTEMGHITVTSADAKATFL